MYFRTLALTVTSIALLGAEHTGFMADEEFTDEDFAQFFGLIEDGKITAEKMNARCEKEVVGFTFAGGDLAHDGGLQRIDYNVTGLQGSVDGRSMRSRHYNLSFGEWTGSVFKPLCPGLWALDVDFRTAAPGNGAADAVRVHIYLRRAGDTRPGRPVLSTTAAPGETGHLSLAVPLRTGDEISTWSEAVGADRLRRFEQVTLTGYKVGHLAKYVEPFDEDAWNADLEALK